MTACFCVTACATNKLANCSHAHQGSERQHQLQTSAMAVRVRDAWVAVAAVAYAGASAAAPRQCAPGSRAWGAGELTLHPGDAVKAGSGDAVATLALTKGNVLQVLDASGKAVWTMPSSSWEKNPCADPGCANDTAGKCEACFQGDGNFVIHNTHGGCAATSTWDDNTGSLELTPHHPYLRIFDADCNTLWWTDPGIPPPNPNASQVKYLPGRTSGAPLLCTPVDPGRCGGHIDIKGVSLVLTAEGNLQVNSTGGGGVLWSAGTWCASHNCTLDLQSDGNLLLHEWHAGKATPSALWGSWTYNNNNGYLLFRNASPFLEFFNQHGTMIWTNLGVVTFNQSILGGVVHVGDAAAAASLRFTASNVANDDDGEVKWAVFDYYGKLVKQGAAKADASNVAVINVSPDPSVKGYFDVVVAGGFNTSFAVVEDNGWAVALPGGHPFGVGTHFSQGVSADLIPLIAKLGANAIRDNGGAWAGVEQEKGVFNFTLAPVYEHARAAGLEPTFVLAFSNPLYTGGERVAPYNKSGYEAYANYALKTVEQYPWVKRFEVWNEYIGSFVQPGSPATANKPYFYTQMIAVVHDVVKAKHPGVLLGGGAAEDIPLPSLDKELALGLCQSSDAVVIHPYGYAEGVERKIATLQGSIEDHTHGKPLRIWATEWSLQGPNTGAGRREDANYAARMAVLMHAAGVDRMHWFLMNDFQSWPRGFVRGEAGKSNPWGRFAVTPAFSAYSTVIHMLAGTAFDARVTPETSDAYALRFTNATHKVTVCWAAQPNASVTISLGSANAFDIEGVLLDPPPFQDGRPFALPSDPMYLVGDVDSIVDPAPVPIADSVLDFSFETQGDKGYTYGYFNNSAIDIRGKRVDIGQFGLLNEYSNDTWAYYWVGWQPECRLFAEGGVPGNASSPARRWSVGDAGPGTIRVEGVVGKPNSGGLPVTGAVYHNRAQVVNVTAPPGSGAGVRGAGVPYSVTLTVSQGDTLDFVLLGDGAGATYPVDDHSTFTFKVFQVTGGA